MPKHPSAGRVLYWYPGSSLHEIRSTLMIGKTKSTSFTCYLRAFIVARPRSVWGIIWRMGSSNAGGVVSQEASDRTGGNLSGHHSLPHVVST